MNLPPILEKIVKIVSPQTIRWKGTSWQQAIKREVAKCGAEPL